MELSGGKRFHRISKLHGAFEKEAMQQEKRAT